MCIEIYDVSIFETFLFPPQCFSEKEKKINKKKTSQRIDSKKARSTFLKRKRRKKKLLSSGFIERETI
jgi:hypothetical protein